MVRDGPFALGIARLRGAPSLALLEPQAIPRAISVCMSRSTSSNSVAAAEAATAPDKIAPLVADFDRVWGDRVTRRRAILDIVQEIGP